MAQARFARTFTGKTVYYTDFKPEMVDIEDIAQALSNICRFNGHVHRHYSVAEHSLLAAELAPDEHKLAALLHDGSEAYLADIVSPAKAMLFDYKSLERKIETAIEEKFCVSFEHQEIKTADIKALYVEARSFYGHQGIEDWGFDPGIEAWGNTNSKELMCYAPPPHKIKQEFMNAFLAYGGKSGN